MNIRLVYADNDAARQTQQLLEVIKNPAERPDAIVVEPVGTGMPRVASAAVAAGVGWELINCNVDYISALRKTAPVPVYSVAVDQEQVGKIQGRQFSVFLDRSGSILYMGPSTGGVSRVRAAGMSSTNLRMQMRKCSEETGHQGAHTKQLNPGSP